MKTNKTSHPSPLSRAQLMADIAQKMNARLETIEDEFQRGFDLVSKYQGTVTVFGSARFLEDNPYYIEARELGSKLVKNGFTVITGGGGGIMEAANRGAKEAGGKSIGCNIELPHEQHQNPYLDRWVNMKYFFVRKVLLTKYSYAFVVMPGGFGTLDWES